MYEAVAERKSSVGSSSEQSFDRHSSAHSSGVWILSDDYGLDGLAERLLQCEASHVIRQPFCSAEGSGRSEQSAGLDRIQKAAEGASIRDLFVVGVCSRVAPRAIQSKLRARLNHEIDPVQRVTGWNRAIRAARQQVVQVRQAVSNHVGQVAGNTGLTVHGLLYLATTGGFSRYDEQTGRFLPVSGLIPASI